MNRLRTGTNRTFLACLGVVLIVGGAWAAATGPALRPHLASWWPRAAPGTVLLDREALGRLREQGWWTPAVVAVLAVGLLLLAAWFAAQLRRGGTGILPLGPPGVTLRARALSGALDTHAGALPGVARARVRVRGRSRRRLHARVVLLLEPDAEPGAVLRSFTRGPLAEARGSAAPWTLDADVRFSVLPHKTHRTHGTHRTHSKHGPLRTPGTRRTRRTQLL